MSGPRTARHVILQLIERGGSALGYRQSWRVACKLQPTDGPAMARESWCRVYIAALRSGGRVELGWSGAGHGSCNRTNRGKHKYKMMSANETGENSRFTGASGGNRSGTVISPKLTEWIGGELQKEALIALAAKGLRKDREVRALSRKGDKANKAADDK